MAFPDLIASPAYREACLTGPMLIKCAARLRNDPANYDSYRVRDAGSRLDHLIRLALDPNVNPDWPPIYLLSAIQAFVEVINEHLPEMQFSDSHAMHAFLDPRMALAREILNRSNDALGEGHHVTSQDFRAYMAEFEAQFQFPFTDIVFENPLCLIAQAYGPFSRTARQEHFYLRMLVYWG